MLKNEMADYSYYSHALKGNYRKGVHRLRALLGAPELARQLCENRGALCVLFGLPQDKGDQNSEALLDVLRESGYAPAAAEAFLCFVAEKNDLNELIEDEQARGAMQESPVQWRAACESEAVQGKLVAQAAGLDFTAVSTLHALLATPEGAEAVTASAAAMELVRRVPQAQAVYLDTPACAAAMTATYDRVLAIWTDEPWRREVMAHDAAQEALAAVNGEIGGKVAAKLAGRDPAQYADAAALAASNQIDNVAASAAAMQMVAATTSVIGAFCAEDNPLYRMFNQGSTPLRAIRASAVARAAVYHVPDATMGKAMARIKRINPEDIASVNAALGNVGVLEAVLTGANYVYMLGLNKAAATVFGGTSAYYGHAKSRELAALRALSESVDFMQLRCNDYSFYTPMLADAQCATNLAREDIADMLADKGRLAVFCVQSAVLLHEVVRNPRLLQRHYAALLAQSTETAAAVLASEEGLRYAMTEQKIASSSAIAYAVARDARALHHMLKDETCRRALCDNNYFTGQYSALAETVKNTAYFTVSPRMKFPCAQMYRATRYGGAEAENQPNSSLVLVEGFGRNDSTTVSAGKADFYAAYDFTSKGSSSFESSTVMGPLNTDLSKCRTCNCVLVGGGMCIISGAAASYTSQMSAVGMFVYAK